MLRIYWRVAALNVATSSAVPAVFHLDALALGALMDLAGVQPARRSPVPAAARSAGATVSPPPAFTKGCQAVLQLLGVLGVQVDLVLRAVQPGADRALGGAAVDVIDEQCLHLLGHARSLPPGAPS